MSKSASSFVVVSALAGIAGVQSVQAYDIKFGDLTTVTPYAMVDIGVSDTKGLNSTIGRDASNNDRLGFRSATKLGEGFFATTGFQHRFDPNTGTNENTGRPFWQGESRIGLKSDQYGWLRLGRGLTPVQDPNGSVEPWGVATVGNLQDLLTAYYVSQEDTTQRYNPYGASPGVLSNGGAGRWDNGVFYDSPTYGGFYTKLAYQVGSGSTPPQGGKSNSFPFGAAVIFADQRLTGFVGYENNNRNTRYIQLGGTYDFGVAKVMASWAKNTHPADPVNAGVTVNSIAIPGAAITGAGFGVHVPIGDKIKLITGYAEARSDAPGAVSAKKGAVGVRYTIIPGTWVYSNVANGRALGSSAAVPVRRNAIDLGVHTEF